MTFEGHSLPSKLYGTFVEIHSVAFVFNIELRGTIYRFMGWRPRRYQWRPKRQAPCAVLKRVRPPVTALPVPLALSWAERSELPSVPLAVF